MPCRAVVSLRMERSSLARILRVAEYFYAALALFALTQGPVYQLWKASSGWLETSPEPSIPHAYFATFVAVQMPALMLAFRGIRTSFFTQSSSLLLGLLVGWLSVTVAWSTLARHSLPEAVALVCTTVFGVYLVTRFSWAERWRIIAAAMSFGLACSLFAIRREWKGAVNVKGDYWIGIYFNRNSLAPVAAIAFISAVAVVLTTPRVVRSKEVVTIGLGVVLALVAAFMLWRSESQTSPAALLVACACVILWWIIRRVSSGMMLTKSWWSPMVMSLMIIAVAVVVFLRSASDVSVASAETATFNSRGALWSMSWSAVQLKPWQGWGWLAAWHTPEFFVQGMWWIIWDTTWSHNGYHDVLLGGGVLAGALFVLYIVTSVRGIEKLDLSESSIRLLTAGFVLAAATQESFFIGSHFLWALLVASLCVVEPRDVALVEQQYPAKTSATTA